MPTPPSAFMPTEAARARAAGASSSKAPPSFVPVGWPSFWPCTWRGPMEHAPSWSCAGTSNRRVTPSPSSDPSQPHFPQLSTKTLARCPDLVEAVHVAVVIGAPVTPGGRRDSLLVACDALARRWQTETVSLGVMT